MSFYAWMAFAFVAGLTGVIAYYKDWRWLAGVIMFGLPVFVVALSGWPYDPDFEDTSLFSIILWVVLACVGVAAGTSAVVLRIVR